MAAAVARQPEHYVVAQHKGVGATEESLDAAAAFFQQLR
jgi:hypothetical protein